MGPKEEDNLLRRLEHTEYGKTVAYLSDEEFEANFGGPPWDLINTALRGLGLPYQYLSLTYSTNAVHTSPFSVEPAGPR